jgi:hypothetical protein
MPATCGSRKAIGSVACMNLFSAMCAAAATLVGDIVRRLTRSTTAALVAMFLLAFSAPLWKYAEVAEVFALNALMAALLLWLFVLWRESPRPAAAFGIGLLCTLLVSHHHTLVLLALPVAVVASFARPQRSAAMSRVPKPSRVRARLIGPGLLGAAVGLAPLLYLPWAAHRNPALNWGDPRLWTRSSAYCRAATTVRRLDPSRRGMQRIVTRFHMQLPPQDSPARGTLVLVGAVAGAHRALGGHRRFSVLQMLFTRVFRTCSPRGVVERFYILPNALALMVSGQRSSWNACVVRAGRRYGPAVAFVRPVALHYRVGSARQHPHRRSLPRQPLPCRSAACSSRRAISSTTTAYSSLSKVSGLMSLSIRRSHLRCTCAHHGANWISYGAA